MSAHIWPLFMVVDWAISSTSSSSKAADLAAAKKAAKKAADLVRGGVGKPGSWLAVVADPAAVRATELNTEAAGSVVVHSSVSASTAADLVMGKVATDMMAAGDGAAQVMVAADLAATELEAA